MNPESQLNSKLLGNTVESPEEEPFMGTVKGPQSTARNMFYQNITYVSTKQICDISITAINLSDNNMRRLGLEKSIKWNTNLKLKPNVHFSIPSQNVWFPLHVPFSWQCLILEPLRLNPPSQPNCILFGKIVRLPKEEPFVGTGRGPQSSAGQQMISTLKCRTSY